MGTRRRVARATASLAALVIAGCMPATYLPTQPRPMSAPGVVVEIRSVRGPAQQAELAIHGPQPPAQPSMIGPVTWSSGQGEPCRGSRLPVARESQVDGQKVHLGLDVPFPSVGDDVVFVELEDTPELAAPGIFVDVAVATADGAGCLRLPLTAAGTETLWRSNRIPWIARFGLRLENPLQDLGGNGAALALEVRGIKPLGWSGLWRPFFGFLMAGATCRGVCPSLHISSDDGTSGLFTHIGGELGLERRFPIGRWSSGVAAGASLMATQLHATADFSGERYGGLWGPFVAVNFFGAPARTFPGFSPPARSNTVGVELSLARQTAFARGPVESAWVAGVALLVQGAN